MYERICLKKGREDEIPNEPHDAMDKRNEEWEENVNNRNETPEMLNKRQNIEKIADLIVLTSDARNAY